MQLNILPETTTPPNLDPTANCSLSDARSGTELARHRLFTSLDRDLIERFQIIAPARFEGLFLTDRPKILWCQDLADDPALQRLREPQFASQFEIVCVSHWQRQGFFRTFPHLKASQVTVIPNAIEPFGMPIPDKPLVEGRWQIAYTSTPHRGLSVLCAAVNALAQTRDDFDVHIFSSFDIYGQAWANATKSFEDIFAFCRTHPRIVYHGTQPNAVVRAALLKTHIFAYPSIYTETSCMAAIEAGAAGCHILTTGLGALSETVGAWANYLPTIPHTYQQDELERLAADTYHWLNGMLTACREMPQLFQTRQQAQAAYFNSSYSWTQRLHEWTQYLQKRIV